MQRRTHLVGVIRCETDVDTLNAVVAAGGVIAAPSPGADHFELLNSGRNLASELGLDLYRAAACALDRAARDGTIPAWSAVKAPHANPA